MNDLKIPNWNKKSNKNLFKRKLNLRRKSKRKLLNETFSMLTLSFFIIYLINLIPEKKIIFNNFINNINQLASPAVELLFYLYQICLTLFIVISLLFAFILILGSISRILKIIKRKTRQISFK